MPFSRSTRTAASMSPFVSCSARFASIIGAPVWSRSSFTSAAEISTIGRHLLRSRLLTLGGLLLLAFRRRLGLGRRRRREVGGSRLLLAGRDPVRDDAHDQVARADRVVLARDAVVRLVRLRVRGDDCDLRQARAGGLTHRGLLLAQVDDEARVRLPLHLGDTAEVLVELLELAEHRDPLLGRQQVELALLLETTELVQAVD